MPEPDKLSIAQLSKALGMPRERIRLYVRLGIFPRPIRDLGMGEGGFWLAEDLPWMKHRRLNHHRFRIPKEIRPLIPPRKRKNGPG
jgi:hypothetical protein